MKISRQISSIRDSQKNCDGNHGFTLVETLVALALMAVMSGLFVMIIGQFHNLRATALRLELGNEVNAALRHVGSIIGSSRKLPLQSENTEHHLSMIGTSGKLKFVAVVRTGSTSSGFREVEIRQEGNPAGADMSIVERHSYRRKTVRSDSHDSLVAEVIGSNAKIEFFYIDKNPDGEVIRQTQWESVDLPSAIQVTISLKRDGASVSHSMIFEITRQ